MMRRTVTVLLVLIQGALATVPSATVWEFQFTDVRSRGGLDAVQLAEVYLYDANGENLTVVMASNPGGDQSLNAGQTADKVVDGNDDNRWLDRSILLSNVQCCDSATLQLTLAEAAPVSSYRFVAAKNTNKRDPTGWRFGYRDAADEFVLLSEVFSATAPTSSDQYEAFPAFMPPSPPWSLSLSPRPLLRFHRPRSHPARRCRRQRRHLTLHPLSPLRRSSKMPPSPPSPATSAPLAPPPSSLDGGERNQSTLADGAIAGVVVICFGAAVLMVLVGLLWQFRRGKSEVPFVNVTWAKRPHHPPEQPE